MKAQVLAGGRGKGHFDNGFKGGVRVVYSPREAAVLAEQMIGHKLITKQTGERGRICNSVYIVEREYARREFYLAILMDRASQSPVIVASSQGGMDIEGVAKENPDAIITTKVDINVGVTEEMAKKVATEIGFSEQCIPEATETIQKLYKVFMEKDATQIEINPLSETSDHRVLCMDAKLNFDDNAEFRQKEVFSWRDASQEDADEVKAGEAGLNFIKLDGDIGCLVNGAGLAMATMDIIKLNGGSPANFLDVGGGATPEAIKQAFDLITSDPKVTAIFVNIFGGIVRCDAIAKGLIQVVQTMNLRTPVIARLQGTNMEQARKLIDESGLKIFSINDLQTAAEKSVQFSKVVKIGKSDPCLCSWPNGTNTNIQLATLTLVSSSPSAFRCGLRFLWLYLLEIWCSVVVHSVMQASRNPPFPTTVVSAKIMVEQLRVSVTSWRYSHIAWHLSTSPRKPNAIGMVVSIDPV